MTVNPAGGVHSARRSRVIVASAMLIVSGFRGMIDLSRMSGMKKDEQGQG